MGKQARDFGAEYQAGRFVPDYHGLGYCVMRKGPDDCGRRILMDGSVSKTCGEMNQVRKYHTLAEALAVADALNAQQVTA